MVEKPYQWGDGATIEEHSKRKHRILREYFERYLRERCKNPNSRRFRLAIVDGFAGGGVYEEDIPGSPVIFAKTLLATVRGINLERAANGMPKVEVDCLLLLNEPDDEATARLREAVAPFEVLAREPDSSVQLSIEFSQGLFEEQVDRFQARIASDRFRNVIYNLDQCGYIHVNRTTIAKLINSNRSVEVFLTFFIQPLLTFLNKTEPDSINKQLRALGLTPGALQFSDELMSKNEWLGQIERIVFDHFTQCAPFVTPFSINNPNGWRYWLMHFASNYRARQIYNDVLHDNSSEQAHFGRAGLRMLAFDPNHDEGSLYLFDSSARDVAKNQLSEDIPRLITDIGHTVQIAEFYGSIYNETPAHSDDIHSAIFESPNLEIVTPSGNKRRYPHTISLDDTIRLTKQLSFFVSKDFKL